MPFVRFLVAIPSALVAGTAASVGRPVCGVAVVGEGLGAIAIGLCVPFVGFPVAIPSALVAGAASSVGRPLKKDVLGGF